MSSGKTLERVDMNASNARKHGHKILTCLKLVEFGEACMKNERTAVEISFLKPKFILFNNTRKAGISLSTTLPTRYDMACM